MEEKKIARIYNFINKLPWHPSRRWIKRSINDVDKIIIHQLASPKYENSTKDIEQNNKYFISDHNHITPGKGIPHFPYHIAIDDCGTIYICNPYEDMVWHAKKFNSKSIGIVLVGSFNGPSFRGKDRQPTKKQLVSLREFLNGIKFYPNLNIENIYGHCEIDPCKNSCPGTTIMKELDKFRKQYS